MYIDDAAFGCPLRNVPDFSDRPFVDWDSIWRQLIQMGIV